MSENGKAELPATGRRQRSRVSYVSECPPAWFMDARALASSATVNSRREPQPSQATRRLLVVHKGQGQRQLKSPVSCPKRNLDEWVEINSFSKANVASNASDDTSHATLLDFYFCSALHRSPQDYATELHFDGSLCPDLSIWTWVGCTQPYATCCTMQRIRATRTRQVRI